MSECIFCQIIQKKVKSWTIWESSTHIAFLSIFPNMKGVTVVTPKQHRPSYAFHLQDQELSDLVIAAKTVALLLDQKLEGVGRTAMVLEGLGVNHVHAKLYPLPNTAHLTQNWQPVHSHYKEYFHTYPGYVCSNDSHRAPDEALDVLRDLLTGH